MKKLVFIIYVVFSFIACSSEEEEKIETIDYSLYQINSHDNAPRGGDKLVKKQVEYVDPGESGENIVWDFSNLQIINNEYTLTYKNPEPFNDTIYKLGRDIIKISDVASEDLVIGIEHNTMYYYKKDAGKLEVLGHENPTTLLQYTRRMTSFNFPTSYGQSYTTEYESEGLYSRRISFASKGTVKITADAFGMIVFPSGDTIKQVVRIRSVQVINETIKTKVPQYFDWIVETYKWYAKGYRYPIFETIREINEDGLLQSDEFKTSFFFPPQDHTYLKQTKQVVETDTKPVSNARSSLQKLPWQEGVLPILQLKK